MYGPWQHNSPTSPSGTSSSPPGSSTRTSSSGEIGIPTVVRRSSGDASSGLTRNMPSAIPNSCPTLRAAAGGRRNSSSETFAPDRMTTRRRLGQLLVERMVRRAVVRVAEEHRRGALGDEGRHRDVEVVVGEDEARADAVRGVDAAHDAGVVDDRDEVPDAIVGGPAEDRGVGLGVVPVLRVQARNQLGDPGGAAGELEDGDVVGVDAALDLLDVRAGRRPGRGRPPGGRRGRGRGASWGGRGPARGRTRRGRCLWCRARRGARALRRPG